LSNEISGEDNASDVDSEVEAVLDIDERVEVIFYDPVQILMWPPRDKDPKGREICPEGESETVFYASHHAIAE